MGLIFDEMWALLRSIVDSSTRIHVLEALQDGDLRIAPVFVIPFTKNKICKKVFYKVLTKKDMQKYLLMTKDKCFMIDVSDTNIWHFLGAYLKFSQLKNKAGPMQKECQEKPAKISTTGPLVGTKRVRTAKESLLFESSFK